MRDQTFAEQAVAYRRSGDYNELHISTSLPAPLSPLRRPILSTPRVCSSSSHRSNTSLLSDSVIGKAADFGGVIFGGLSTFGFGARGIVSAAGRGDPASLRLFGMQCAATVKPSGILETSIWEIGHASAPGHEGETEVAFVMRNVATGKVCPPPGCVLRAGEGESADYRAARRSSEPGRVREGGEEP